MMTDRARIQLHFIEQVHLVGADLFRPNRAEIWRVTRAQVVRDAD